MSKCNKVKNPCKICLEPVSHKNGLQCQGACESWVHYSCLNYTPGKIKDIKAGIIKVTCPCPDCKTSLPKEYRTDEPYSCTNIQCPANRPPHCENKNCSLNSGTQKMNQTLVAPPCPLKECGNSCKQHSTPHVSNISKLPTGGSSTPSQISSSYDFLTPKKCPSGCSSSTEIPGGDVRRNATVDLAGMPALIAVKQMCNTVGQLTNQLNQMMMNLKQAVNGKGFDGEGGCAHGNCQQKGPKSLCPKPCYCPGNPGRGRRR
ncbi:uncharacterized protein LOC113514540 [Galleria mellonella]|uniref:Uncharacterized protein LOC113514540 n=1 Tax=Galleria mellonella TaxID=7137 RepID=A0A6J1WQP4_GALME|nr:uncharacterized protein LOC113514540 [Galleria mellonella]